MFVESKSFSDSSKIWIVSDYRDFFQRKSKVLCVLFKIKIYNYKILAQVSSSKLKLLIKTFPLMSILIQKIIIIKVYYGRM